MLGKGTQINNTQSINPFSKTKELPWVGFEPMTLCSLGMSALPTEDTTTWSTSGSLHCISTYHYQHSYTCSDGLVCDEPFCEVISVSLHMSVITQYGDSALMMAAKWGSAEVVPLLLEAGANTDLQNEVKCQ